MTRDTTDGLTPIHPFIAALRRRKPFGRLAALATAGALTAAACATAPAEQAGSRQADLSARSWAPLPEEVPMPAAAPDDPAAYRGVRFTTWFGKVPPFPVNAAGRTVPWLGSEADQYGPAVNTLDLPDGPWFGRNEVRDGRRRMLWFFRLVEPLPSPPVHPSPHPPGGERAVLDVLTLPDEPAHFEWANCGPDPVIVVGRDGWRLNRTTGRIVPTDPGDAACPEYDD